MNKMVATTDSRGNSWSFVMLSLKKSAVWRSFVRILDMMPWACSSMRSWKGKQWEVKQEYHFFTMRYNKNTYYEYHKMFSTSNSIVSRSLALHKPVVDITCCTTWTDSLKNILHHRAAQNRTLLPSVLNIQGQHTNTPWFQVVIKSKLTGIFLQNWWLQLHKLIQFHVVSHTLNVPPSCYSANIDAII